MKDVEGVRWIHITTVRHHDCHHMARRRDYVEEILNKRERHLKRVARHEQFTRRVHPLVKGFRFVKSLDPNTDFRREWLKYGAIGYIACVEGYFRMLFADLINFGKPYSDRTSEFKDIKFNIDDVIAIHARKVSLGEYIAHLLPLNGIQDINYCMSTILSEDFLHTFRSSPASEWNPTAIGELFPNLIPEVESLFHLRHLYCHELAPKISVQPRKVERYIGSAAAFVWHTEELIQTKVLNNA